MIKEVACQPLLKTGKAGSALFKMKGVPPFYFILRITFLFF